MGFMGTLKNANSARTAGYICGKNFPLNTYVNFDGASNKDPFFSLLYEDGRKEKVTPDMIQCATILVMDAQDVKYLCVFKDGRQGVMTINRNFAQSVECVIF